MTIKIRIKRNFILFKIPEDLTLYDLKKFFLIFLIMAKYIERLKEKVKIKKFDSNQPIGAWIFVVVLNIVGFAGYFYLKVNHIQLGS